MPRAVSGLLAGMIATAVMSAQMLAAPSTVRIGTPPPRRIAEVVLPDGSATDHRIAATLIHLGIGASSGLVYRAVVARRRGGIASGTLFGLAIWVVGYELVVPALRVLPAAHRDRASRRAALMEAHAVYGAVLGALS